MARRRAQRGFHRVDAGMDLSGIIALDRGWVVEIGAFVGLVAVASGLCGALLPGRVYRTQRPAFAAPSMRILLAIRLFSAAITLVGLTFILASSPQHRSVAGWPGLLLGVAWIILGVGAVVFADDLTEDYTRYRQRNLDWIWYRFARETFGEGGLVFLYRLAGVSFVVAGIALLGYWLTAR